MKTITIATMSAMILAGSASADIINVPGDYDSIRVAVENAQNGDVVAVAAGTYFETQRIEVYKGQGQVTITGEVDESGAPAVVIDMGGANDHVIVVNGNDVNVLLENLVLTGSDYENVLGPGLYLNNDGQATVRNCVIRNNKGRSGAVFVSSSTALFEDCVIEDNEASQHGGGMWIAGHADLLMSNCIVRNNVAFEYGGGIHCNDGIGSFELVDGCSVSGNQAGEGGGIYFHDGSTVYSLNDCVISNNSAVKYGGGIYIRDYAYVSGGVITNNRTDRFGGGVYISESGTTISGSEFRDNVAELNGGGIYFSSDSAPYPDVVSSTICGNMPNQVWHIESDASNIINTSCESNPAACCVNGACIMVEPLMCDDVGGTLSNGGEEDCSSTECAEPCLGDVNNDSEINVNDLLTVIANWGGCP